VRKPPARKGRGFFHAQNLLESNGQTVRFLGVTLTLWYYWCMPGRSWRKVSTMSNPFDNPDIINGDAVDALTDEQVATVLSILTKAGY